jgi:tRNA (guanine-N7-)-methyltransferase
MPRSEESADGDKRRRIEREFGVPVPGEIVDESRWTRTALKNLPDSGPLDWTSLFGRDAPKVIDLGCGNGRFLIGSAVWRPDHDHLGTDILPVVIRYATRRANQRGLSNIRFAVIGGRELLERHIVPHTISEIHCYHPQPYYDPAEFSKRLVTPELLALVHRSLAPGGRFFIQSDNAGYWNYLCEVVPEFFEFEQRTTTWPDAPRGRTRREIIALRHGHTIYRGTGSPRADLTDKLLPGTAARLPPPSFNPGRPPRELDRLEQS